MRRHDEHLPPWVKYPHHRVRSALIWLAVIAVTTGGILLMINNLGGDNAEPLHR